jgi:hypothetical protein
MPLPEPAIEGTLVDELSYRVVFPPPQRSSLRLTRSPRFFIFLSPSSNVYFSLTYFLRRNCTTTRIVRARYSTPATEPWKSLSKPCSHLEGTATSTVISNPITIIIGARGHFAHLSDALFVPPHTDYPTGRILRDARLYCVGAGTQEIRRMLIGREFNMDYGV